MRTINNGAFGVRILTIARLCLVRVCWQSLVCCAGLAFVCMDVIGLSLKLNGVMPFSGGTSHESHLASLALGVAAYFICLRTPTARLLASQQHPFRSSPTVTIANPNYRPKTTQPTTTVARATTLTNKPTIHNQHKRRFATRAYTPRQSSQTIIQTTGA
jgi:hypothetical protein